MKRPGKIVTVVLLAGALGLASWQMQRKRTPEPVYEGRPLSAWVQDGLMEDNHAWRVLTIQPGHHRFEEFVPYAIAALQTKDSCFWKPYTALRAGAPKFIAKRLPEWRRPRLVRLRAAEWLRDNWNGEPREAVLVLCEVANSNSDPELRQLAVAALCNTRAYNEEVLPRMLSELANNRDNHTRGEVAKWFIRAKPDPERTIPALIQGMDSSAGSICTAAIKAYRQQAIAPLQRLVRTNDLSVATRAGWLLKAIDPEAAAREEGR